MATTPERAVALDGIPGTLAITEAQKQALIDNLQLESMTPITFHAALV